MQDPPSKGFVEPGPDVIEPHPAVFVHLQKTAGTSIVRAARSAYDNDVTSHGDYLAWPRDEVLKRRFVSGHFGYHFAKPLMDDRFSFTFLREPLDRLVSMYYFCRSSDPAQYEIYACANETSFDEFLSLALRGEAGISEVLYHTLWNHQAWQLAFGWAPSHESLNNTQMHRSVGKTRLEEFDESEIRELAAAHLDEFDHIGFREDYASDFRTILGALGVPIPQVVPRSNVTASRPKVTDLPQSTIEKMLELTELDRALYHSAWKQRTSQAQHDIESGQSPPTFCR